MTRSIPTLLTSFFSSRLLSYDLIRTILAIGKLDGSFTLALSLQPRDETPTTFRIRASFGGDEPQTATAYATTPNGTQYPVCTTLQYFGYKPASNCAWLTVEPQAAQVMTSTKTPEELQAEAEQSGWLQIWHEFTWWYPWYRMHLMLDVDLPQGHLHMDY